MSEIDQLIQLITDKKPLAAMVAPSFPVVYEYPAIITTLRQLGFAKVVEVAIGAKKTNEQLLAAFTENPEARFITSPCPTLAGMIRKTKPEYAQFLTTTVDSPMIATAKIVAENFPGVQPVFIGPCIAKKMEAKQEHPELNIIVITYAELDRILQHFNIVSPTNVSSQTDLTPDKFDLTEADVTRIYPLDAGLSVSSEAYKILPPGSVKTVIGWKEFLIEAEKFVNDPSIKLLDILNCPGGCIGGPGIKSPLTTEQRKQKVLDFYKTQAATKIPA